MSTSTLASTSSTVPTSYTVPTSTSSTDPTSSTVPTSTSSSVQTSPSSSVQTSTQETTYVMSEGNDSTVILVAVMVVVGVIVVVIIIVLLLCINRRMKQRPIQSEQTPAARPRVFKRIETRVTHLYDSIKESNVISRFTGTRQLDISTPMPLPKQPLHVKPSGLYDSIKSNTMSRIGTDDVLNEADNRKLLAKRNSHTDTYLNMGPAKHTYIDDSAYVSMDGNSIPEDEYVNLILKSKSVKYINCDGAQSEQANILKMEQTAVGSTDDVYVNTNLHQNSQKDESIYLSMDSIDIDNETGNTAEIVHKTNVSNDRADQEQPGNAISELNVDSVESRDMNDTDVDDHYYTNCLVKSGKVGYVFGDIHHYEQDA